MKRLLSTTLPRIAALLLLSLGAEAQQFALEVDPVASDVMITLGVTFGTSDVDGPKPLVLSGDASVATTLVDDPTFGTLVSRLTFQSSALTAADLTFDLDVVNFFVPFHIDVDTQSMGGRFDGPTLLAGAGTAPGTAPINLPPLTLVLDQGTLVATVSPPGTPSPTDLAATPLIFDLSGAATSVITSGPDGPELELTLPVSQMTTSEVQGVTADVTLTGNLVLRGSISAVGIPVFAPFGLGALILGLLGGGIGLLRRPRR